MKGKPAGWGKSEMFPPVESPWFFSRRFEPGTALIVEIEETPRQLPVRVVHATPATKGRWIIGCAFASILSEEELQAFFRK